MYVPFPPRLPSGTIRPSPNAFLIAAVVLKPQYRAACAVVIGPSRKQLGSAAVDKEASGTPSARSCSRTVSRTSSRKYSSRVTFESQVTNVFNCWSAIPSDRHAHPAAGVWLVPPRPGISKAMRAIPLSWVLGFRPPQLVDHRFASAPASTCRV
jgi:hypothetical protein